VALGLSLTEALQTMSEVASAQTSRSASRAEDVPEPNMGSLGAGRLVNVSCMPDSTVFRSRASKMRGHPVNCHGGWRPANI